MTFSKARNITIIGAVLAFSLVFWGLSIVKKQGQKQAPSTTVATAFADSVAWISTARNAMSGDTADLVDQLADELNGSENSQARIESLKRLSGIYYRANQFAAAGLAAQRVAELEKSGEAWNIAGSTFAACISEGGMAQMTEQCQQRAIECYEKAILLDSNNVEYQIGLANVYISKPLQDNPMKGIQMLLSLNKKHPENISVLNLLGQLAIKTGQHDKAIARLEKALTLDGKNKQTICLLAQAYQAAGQAAKASEMEKLCNIH